MKLLLLFLSLNLYSQTHPLPPPNPADTGSLYTLAISGVGTTGQVLTTNGAGVLTWTTNAALTELEAQKKTIADLIKRIEKLEAK